MVQEMLGWEDTYRVRGDMCQFGMKQTDQEGEASVRKRTGFMTNSWAIAERLKRTCTGGHRHIILVGGRAKKAQQYPDGLCKEILRGLEEQMRIDGRLKKRTSGRHSTRGARVERDPNR